MNRLSQRLCAAIAAVLGLGGMAFAQSGTPNPLPVIPLPPAQSMQGVPFQSIVDAPAQPVRQIQNIQAVPSAQPAGPTAPTVQASLGCSTCNSCGSSGKLGPNPYLPQNTAFGAGLAPIPYGEFCSQCANGCGSYKSTAGFIFGSCKSFFNPCGPIPCGAGGCGTGGCGGNHLGGGCNKCGVFPFGKPYGHGFNTCVYDSNLNH